MLAETVQQWYAEAEAQGLQRGLQQGIQQGIQTGQLKGEQSLFHYQLQTKFGQLAPEVEERISTLNTEALHRCVKRLLTAVTLEEVFQEVD